MNSLIRIVFVLISTCCLAQNTVFPLTKFSSEVESDYIYYEKYKYDFLNFNFITTPETKQDSILYNLEKQKEKYLDYLQEQVYFLDSLGNKKVYLEKKAGINKSSFDDFYNSNFSIQSLKNDSIYIGNTYFINPFSQYAKQNIEFKELDKRNYSFQFKNQKGIVLLDSFGKIDKLQIQKTTSTSSFALEFSNYDKNNIPKEIVYNSVEKNKQIQIQISLIEKVEEIKTKKKVNYSDSKLKKWNQKISTYRKYPLSEIEEQTYKLEDALITREKIVTFSDNLVKKQKIDLGKFEINPFELVSFNGYEGFRVQVGGGTSNKLSESLKFSRYLAYGFKDKKFKFGGFFDYTANKKYNSIFQFGYINDVNPAGRTTSNEKRNFNTMFSQVNNFNYDTYYKFQNFFAGFRTEYFDKLKTKVELSYKMIEPKFNYVYKNDNSFQEFTTLSSKFDFFWMPNSKYIHTDYGKVTIKEDYPFFKFQIDKHWKAFDADFDFTKFNFKAIYETKTFKGNTKGSLRAGYILGNAPLTHLYEGLGTSRNGNSVIQRWGVAGVEVFETMIPGRFFSDKYVSLDMNHRFNSFRLGRKNYSIHLLYRALLGTISNENKINNNTFSFDSPKNIYQEVGVELPKLVLNKMLGIGMYYRIGAYQKAKFEDNFFIKLTIDFPSAK
ncbi:MAG: hypothetical protein H6604_00545 [Flavobacteriales bacterium]|nr:hypothetical protein [Flavobacteriales bacterium]